ncbi:hypothetical protein BMF94_6485 [Rhodotorula taiwanensis]|uniref:Uncharacterized protein n=1 Tax=Rhodotorula taiwanensis TaxID=741276 RepID=A0A2S5B1A3_9BASI|nr:hypothetical protein BMF94_6485 [Rhodotorula taiwanensis]
MVVRRVLLDAFGTIFSPREPVHVQYAAVARSYGLLVEDVQVKTAFKDAFKLQAQRHPLYGKRSRPPLEPSEWWATVILDTFRGAGISEAQLTPIAGKLSTELVERFWGAAGYDLHGDVEPFLRALHSLPCPPSGSAHSTAWNSSSSFPAPVVVSNTDPAVVKILDSLGVLENRFEIRQAGIREDQVFTTWQLEEDKKEVRFWDEVLRRLRRDEPDLSPNEVLVIGDELVSDYKTPRLAGYRTLLLRRDLANGEHARASYDDEKAGPAVVDTVRDLVEVADLIRRENAVP